MDDQEELAAGRAEIDVDGKLIREVKLYPFLAYLSQRLRWIFSAVHRLFKWRVKPFSKGR